MGSKKLQKIDGVFVIFEAFIYITALIAYGGMLEYPSATAGDLERVTFLTDNYITFSF